MRRLAGAALAATAAALVGCGGGEDDDFGDLVWSQDPRVFRAPNLPRDRILTGTIRNDSLRPVELEASDVHAVGADGDELQTVASFAGGYLHGLYPPTRPPAGGLPDAERERTGRLVKLRPGATAPLSVAWRLPSGRDGATRIDWGAGSLRIPARDGR